MILNLTVLMFIYWGLVPIFYKQITHVSSIDVMAHRIIWSTVLLAIYLLFARLLPTALAELKNPKRAGILFITGALIASDWGLFIYMVDAGEILETSLGYFISPIIGIFFAKIFLKERLGKLNVIALCLAIIACCYEAFTLGHLPVLSILLAVLTNLYTLIRKLITISAKYGFFLETLLMTPFALIFLILRKNGLEFNIESQDYLLVASGLVTVLPMIVLNYITPKISLSLLSILQYITPVISFIVAIALYNEALEIHKIISFSLIIVAVILSICERRS